MSLWIYFAVWVASLIVTTLLAPKPPKPRPAALADFEVPTADASRPIPVIFGTVWCNDPNVVNYGDLRVVPIKKGGKK